MPFNPSEINEHMEVVGSDGAHVGTVDKVEGKNIKLTKNGPASGGKHRMIADNDVDRISNDKVMLKRTAAEVQGGWGAELTF